MLLTLTARSLVNQRLRRGTKQLALDEMPRFVLEQTALRGLVLDTDLLKGWSMDRLDDLRISADQAGCPCLLLRESADVLSGSRKPQQIETAMKRVELVARAATRLGCNSMSLRPAPLESTTEIDAHAEFYRNLMERIDRLDIHLLLEPSEGVLAEPHALIALVKKVGGFRIGTLPTWNIARQADDVVAVMRTTAPYAGTVLANWSDEDLAAIAQPAVAKKTKRVPVVDADDDDLTDRIDPNAPMVEKCLAALVNIGYEQILAIDYVGKSENTIAAINAIRDFIIARVEDE
jgi:hypothetical protein